MGSKRLGVPGAASRHLRLPVLLAFLAVLAVAALPATAYAAPELESKSTESADPSSITFRARVQSGANLASATLNYKVLNPDGIVGGSIITEVAPGRTVDLSAQLPTINNERYIPIGARFAYSWTIVDANGDSLVTPEEEFVFLDGRFQWQSSTEDNVTVYWYGGNDADAARAMTATIDAIDDIGALLRVELPYPVRLVLWRNSAEGRAAQRPRALTFDQQVVTGGSRVAPDVLHVYAPLGNFVDVTRHEAAHLVTKVAGDGPFTSIPSWLDEGTAVYAQNSPGPGYESAVRLAIQSDQTTRLRAMASPANRADLVNLHYGQSWHVVKFMVDTYGEEQFADIFREVKQGSPIDEALETVISVNQDGLYNAWRESVGLQPIEYAPITQAQSPTMQATRPPLRIPTSVAAAGSGTGSQTGAQPGSSADPQAGAPGEGGAPAGEAAGAASGTDTGPMTAMVIGALTLLLAGALGFLGLRIARSR